MIADVEIRHFHMFCGLGGGALGFNRGKAQHGNMRANFRCIGGVDNSPAAIRDFDRLSGCKGTVIDLFDREQYFAFHGKYPPIDWREATPQDIQRAAGGERPHIVFLSAPCKGFSGLLSETRSKSGKYQALNRLTLRGIFLMLEAWKDDPPELIVFENVPRIATRGRALLDQITKLLRLYGYAVAETFHDCGEIGGLAQSRKRFLMVARHTEKVRPFLYQPEKRPLRAVGEILSKLPMPGDPRGGPMHLLPNLQWKTWVRLAFVEPGSDWRSLKKLNVVDGKLADYALAPDGWYGDTLGVIPWDESSGTITGMAAATRGAFSVADPRFVGGGDYSQYGVKTWDETAGTVTGQGAPGQGPISVADPRLSGQNGPRYNNVYRVIRWNEASQAVSGGTGPSAGGLNVADPRGPVGPAYSKYAVTRTGTVIGGDDQGAYAVADPRPHELRSDAFGLVGWDDPTGTVAGESHPSNGKFAVADPRPGWDGRYGALDVADWKEPSSTIIAGGKGVQGGWLSVADPRVPNYGPNSHTNKLKVVDWDKPTQTVTGGQHVQSGLLSVADPRIGLSRSDPYGVVPWDASMGAVLAGASIDNGRFSVADPRITELPESSQKLVALIRSIDGTWHRPFTTLELASLQSLIEPDDIFDLDGSADGQKRERIGNAVPAYAAQAIANVMGQTLLLAWSGETFQLSALPIWVQPVAVALSVRTEGTPA